MLRVVVSNLPLKTLLEIFQHIEPSEQSALANYFFGRVVNWRKDVRRGKVSPEEAEKIQRLVVAFKMGNGQE